MKHPYIAKRYWNTTGTAMGGSGDLVSKYPDLVNFSLGDPDVTTPESIIQAAFQDALDGHTHYTSFYGDEELIQELVNYYKEDFGMEVAQKEILVTTSACHAMWLALEAILDDGDEVIIPSPFFTPYPGQVKLARGVPVFVNTYFEDEFAIQPEALEKAITNRTKAIIVNTPANPTGVCLSRETLQSIAEIAKKHDLLVIADDIYTAFSYEEEFLPISSLEGMRERTITLGSFSKNYAMTGWRVGYIMAPEAIVHTAKEINENNVFTAPSVSQRAALHGLRQRNEVVPPLVEEFKKRTFHAYERLRRLKNVEILPPKGTFYLFPRIAKTGLSSEEVAKRLLEEARVLVLPGTAFGDAGEGHIRLAVTLGTEDMDKAFDRIEQMDIFR